MDNRNIEQYFNKQAENWDNNSYQDPQKIKDILEICDLNSGHKILDVGCGTGILFSFLLAYEPDCVVGVDISEAMVRKARSKFNDKRLTVLNKDFYRLSMNGFNTVILFNSYPHFCDKLNLAKKIFKVLKKGGHFVIAHDQGKEQVNAVHIRKNVNRYCVPLKSVYIEWDSFESLFTLDKYFETDDLYIILGRKS